LRRRSRFGAAAMEGEPPPLRIGLIADIQHADIPDGSSDYGAARHYRDATAKARLAAADWRAAGCAFAVNLGDTVDRRGGGDAPAALQRVFAALAGFAPIVHIPGNHDFSALGDEELAMVNPVRCLEGLDAISGPGWYCDIRPGPGWRVLVIDTYDVCVHRDAAAAQEVRGLLRAQARARSRPSQHLTAHQELNGAVGAEQLAWVRSRLTVASEAQEQMVVLAHAALHIDATCYGDALCWNWEEVSGLLDAFPHVVAAVITGHDHYGGSATSAGGIHHRVLEAALEGAVGAPTHAVLELRGRAVRLAGRGHVRSWAQDVPNSKQ